MLNWQVQGTAASLPDIVLEHGGSGSSANFRQLAPLLAHHGRVFTYDRAGFGRSPRDDGGYGVDAVSSRLASLIERMGVRKPFVLAGYSLGGLYAQHYAAWHPEHIAGLVLLDTTPTGFPLPADRVRKAMRILGALHWLARSGVATALGVVLGKRRNEEFQQAVADLGAPDFLRNVGEEIGAIGGIQAEVGRLEPRLRHPTLAVIAGLAPRGIKPAEFPRLRALHEALAAAAPAPVSRLAVVEGANHATLLTGADHVASVAGHIVTFAKSL